MSDIFQDVVTPLFHEKNLVCNEDEMCGILVKLKYMEWKATLRKMIRFKTTMIDGTVLES